MGILGDSVRQMFGFPTELESLDYNIDHLNLHEEQDIDRILAKTAIDISYIEEQIRQLEQVINDNQTFIDGYETIKKAAIAKVEMSSSIITGKIVDDNGNVLVNSNYATMKSYSEVISKQGNVNLLKTYIEQMGKNLDLMWQAYAYKVIKGKGLFPGGDEEFQEGYQISGEYNRMLINMESGRLRDANRESKSLNGSPLTILNGMYNIAQSSNNVLYMAYQQLNNALRELKSAQASVEYKKQIIEGIRKMLKTTSEYFSAKASSDALNNINSLKR